MYSFDLKIRMVNNYNNSNNTLRDIATDYNKSKSSLHRWINNKCLNRQPIKTEYKNRVKILNLIKRSIDHNPFQTLDLLKTKIKKKFNLELTKMTISRYMKIIRYSKKKITKKGQCLLSFNSFIFFLLN